MAREQSRIKVNYLQEQAAKRKALAEIPGDSSNSIPALRDRVTVLEEILSLRVHGS